MKLTQTKDQAYLYDHIIQLYIMWLYNALKM